MKAASTQADVSGSTGGSVSLATAAFPVREAALQEDVERDRVEGVAGDVGLVTAGGGGNNLVLDSQGNDIIPGDQGHDFRSGVATGDTVMDFAAGTGRIDSAAGPAGTASNFGATSTASTAFASIQTLAQALINGGDAYAFVADGDDGVLVITGGSGTSIGDAVKLAGAGSAGAVKDGNITHGALA